MYTEIKYEMMPDGTRLSEFRGLSTDDKPTDGVCNGSSYLEMDTGFTSYFCGSKTETVAYGEGHTALCSQDNGEAPYIGFPVDPFDVQTMFTRYSEYGDEDGFKFILNGATYERFVPTGDSVFGMYTMEPDQPAGFDCELFADSDTGDLQVIIRKPDGSVFTETISIEENKYVVTGEGENEYVSLGVASPEGGTVFSGNWTESAGD